MSEDPSQGRGKQQRPQGHTSPARALFAMITAQDAFMLLYLSLVSILVWRAAPGPEQDFCARRVYICIAIIVLGSWVARMARDVPYVVRWFLYRLAIAGVLLENYLMLRELLPLIRPDNVDTTLLAIDYRIFGLEPALWLERFNRTPIIEWFSFFYFSYFFICLIYLLVVAWFSKGGRQTAEFAFGTLIVFCIGQLGYMAVPAYGPIRFLTSEFHGPLQGGFFWGCVWKTVQAGSAMKDVFPSLHTAVPSWFTLFALHRSRVDPRWKWPARVTGFFAANIIISTMLLRWHYAIDVVAGLCLASTAGYLAPRVARWEEAWRIRNGLLPAWTFEKKGDVELEQIRNA